MNLVQKWKEATHSTRVAVSLAVGLGVAFFLMTMGYLLPLLSANMLAWFLRLKEAGINVPVSLATIEMVVLYVGLAAMAQLQAGEGRNIKPMLAALSISLFILTNMNLTMMLVSVRLENSLKQGPDIFSAFSINFLVMAVGFVLYLFAKDNSSDRRLTYYGLTAQLAGFPAGLMAVLALFI